MTNRDTLILLNSTLSLGQFHKPFTNSEIVKIIDKLKEKSLELKDLNKLSKNEMHDAFFITGDENEKNTLFIERMFRLLAREGSMAFDLMEIKKWGIEILTIFDSVYPDVFKKYLGKKAPTLLYYCGNLDLLTQDYIGFSGPRLNKISEDDEVITRSWAKHIVDNNYGIVSGGATGVDTFAVQEAISKKANFIEFLSDSMIKRIKISHISRAIQAGHGLLMSETNPYAPFNAGMAMARNKYIYLLAKKVIIIKADYTIKAKFKTGGTWNGAVENLKSNYPKAYVIENPNLKGNKELIELGAIPIRLPADLRSSQMILDKSLNKDANVKEMVVDEIERRMIEILKKPKTIYEVQLTDKQFEKITFILEAIEKVHNSFSEFLVEKAVYNKFYKYCNKIAVGKSNIQTSLFD